MKNRFAIFFFLSWSAIFACGLLFLRRAPAERMLDFQRSFSSLDPEKVVSAEIHRRNRDSSGGRERISVVRENGRWMMESPARAEADGATVRRFIDTVVFLEATDRLTASDMKAMGLSMRDFRLDRPQYAISLSDGERAEWFFFGRTTPDGAETYMKPKGADFVATVPTRSIGVFSLPATEWRRRRLFSFDPRNVTGIAIKEAGESLYRLVRSGDSWRLADPADAPADRDAAEALVSALCSAEAVDFAMSAEETLAGFDEGCAVSLRDAAGAAEKITFGAPAGSNTVWALAPDGSTVRVPSALLDLCRRRPKYLEDTRLFPVDAKAVVSVSVSTGFPAYVLHRDDTSSWRLASPADAPADPDAASALLSRMLELRSADLYTEESGGIAAEVSIATAVTNFPPVKTLLSSALGGARFEELRDKTVLKCPRAKIRGVRVTTAAGSRWNAAESPEIVALIDSGIRATAIDSVSLKPEDMERCGFIRPSYTIAVEIEGGSSAMKTILLGAPAPGGGRFATAGGSDASFILPAQTVSVLTKPEEEKP